MPRSKKGLGRCHKSGTGNNQDRRRTTPRDHRVFNRNNCHSKSIEMSLPVISVSIPLNNSVINPPQLSSVCQQSPGLHLTVLVIKNALIATTLTQRAMNLVYFQNTIIKLYWKTLKQEKILTMMNMWKKKITTMLIVMNLIMM